jgi:hypothetical protein
MTCSDSCHANMIAVGAIAVIVTLFALAHPSRAEIVYTPVNVVIENSTYSLDLNNDGTTDFTISGVNKFGYCSDLFGHHHIPRDSATIKALPVLGNGVEGGGRAAALDQGSTIGPGQKFYGAASLLEHVKIGDWLVKVGPPPDYQCEHFDIETGNWFDFTGYLGLQFQMNGETHFGWAAVSVQFDNSQVPWTLSATLTGYAYETVAGQSISAGQTSGP